MGERAGTVTKERRHDEEEMEIQKSMPYNLNKESISKETWFNNAGQQHRIES